MWAGRCSGEWFVTRTIERPTSRQLAVAHLQFDLFHLHPGLGIGYRASPTNPQKIGSGNHPSPPRPERQPALFGRGLSQ